MCAIHGNAFYHGVLRAGHRTVNFVSETDDWFMMCISHATELCKHHCAPLKPVVKFVEEIIGHGWKKLKWTCMKYIEIHVWSTLAWQQLSFGDYIRHRFGSLTAENSLCFIKGPSCEPNPPCEAESLCLLEAIREASAGVPFVGAPVFGHGAMCYHTVHCTARCEGCLGNMSAPQRETRGSKNTSRFPEVGVCISCIRVLMGESMMSTFCNSCLILWHNSSH